MTHNWLRHLLERDNTFIGHQRQIILACYFVAMVATLSSNILGLSGAFHPFFTITNSLLLSVILLMGLGYVCRWAGIVTTLSVMTLATQLALSADTVFSAITPQVPNNYMVIIVNMILLSGNIIVSLSTYLTRTTQVSVAMAITTYILCIGITNDAVLKDYAFMLLVVLVFFGFLGFRIAKNAERLENENMTLRQDEAELLHILRLNKAQVKAYIKLASGRHNTEHTRRLLDLLGERSQRNLLANVIEFLQLRETEKNKIAQALPELTPSETDICQLILRNKKLSEVCAILGKTESNISTQRANIRRKLKMKPSDNLQQILEQRMKKRGRVPDFIFAR